MTDPRGTHVAVPDPVVSDAGDPPVDVPLAAPAQAEPVGAETSSPVSDGPAVAEEGTADAVAPDPQLSRFSMALVSAVSVDLPNQHPTVVLRESESPRRQLSFSVGLPEAVALSLIHI